MAAPARKRPGDSSPIALKPEVEQVTTPAADGAAETPAASTGAATSVAAKAPAARKRTTRSGPSKGKAKAQTTQPTPPETNQTQYIDPRSNTSVNLSLPTTIKKRLETAVLRTAGFEGAPRSQNGLIVEAVIEKLEALEEQFNDGAEFPPNMSGPVRTGRPLGS